MTTNTNQKTARKFLPPLKPITGNLSRNFSITTRGKGPARNHANNHHYFSGGDMPNALITVKLTADQFDTARAVFAARIKEIDEAMKVQPTLDSEKLGKERFRIQELQRAFE
jgi:hypothetical protein